MTISNLTAIRAMLEEAGIPFEQNPVTHRAGIAFSIKIARDYAKDKYFVNMWFDLIGKLVDVGFYDNAAK